MDAMSRVARISIAVAVLAVVVAGVATVWPPAHSRRGVAVRVERLPDAPGVHNRFRLTPTVTCGSQPEGAVGFRTLAAGGVKTVVSVDGAAPDGAAAKAAGLTYVHLPVGYDGVSRERAVALAKLIERGEPIYVHCHHGRHRGPAAVAAALRCVNGSFDAEAFLTEAGTDPRYAGLYRDVRQSHPLTAEERRAGVTYVGRMPVTSLVERMVAIDETWERIKACQKAGWATPPGHPDVSPAREALQLVEHYRELGRIAPSPEFETHRARAEAAAADLEKFLRTESGPAGEAFTRSLKLCSQCHAATRDAK
jgi:hypothetical protein